MLQLLNFEQLDSRPFVEIGTQFEELWNQLRKRREKLDVFLVSRNPFQQGLRDRIIIGSIGVPLDCAETVIGREAASRLRNAIIRRVSRELTDFSYVILRSNRLWAPRYWEYPWAITNTRPAERMVALDIGSGWSLFPMYLARLGMQVIATDIDERQVRHISPYLAGLVSARVQYEIGDVASLEFPDNTFERIYCISVLEHLEEEVRNGRPINLRRKNLDVTAIGEMLRVLKPSGLLCITVDWSESPENLRSYRLDDIWERLIAPFRSYLVCETKPSIDWDSYKPKLIDLWRKRFPYDTEEEALSEASAAVGILIRKPE